MTDFTDPARRKLADLYWQQQQDEGEPVFNEFLDVLRAASDEDGSADLPSLAVELVTELDGQTAADEGPAGGPLLADALRLLDEIRAGEERDKLMAQLRRTSGADADAPNRCGNSRSGLGGRTCGGWAAKVELDCWSRAAAPWVYHGRPA